jgi:hemin uptake protein HemP
MLNKAPAMSAGGPAPESEASGTSKNAGPGSPRVVQSNTLLGGASQLAILHNETVYFLRQTRFGKLILTK